MRSLTLFGVSALVTLMAVGASAAPCTPPPPVADYLKTHPQWRLLDIKDLVSDDRMIWHDNHKGLCPGMAKVVLDSSGLPSYALALIRPDKGKTFEQVVVLQAGANAFKTVVLEPPFEGTGIVIWRAPPGKTQDMYGDGRTITVRHDSIIWEKMESASQQFYLVRGKFRKAQTSD